MIVEIAIGDAYGAPFEFADQEFIDEHNKLESYLKRKTKWDTTAGGGRYTDDTSMSIAVIEHILLRRPFTPHGFMKTFLDNYWRDELRHGRAGYSKRMVKLFEDLKSDDRQVRGKAMTCFQTTSNGCVMRAVPLGMLQLTEIEAVTISQTCITHASFEAIQATLMIAYSAHYLFYKLGKLEDLGDWLDVHMDWRSIETAYREYCAEHEDWQVPCDARITASAVWEVLMARRDRVYNTMSQMLKRSISFGGDVDSVASIVMGLASLSDEITNDLPAFLYNDLEHTEFGIGYLQQLDEKVSKYRDDMLFAKEIEDTLIEE